MNLNNKNNAQIQHNCIVVLKFVVTKQIHVLDKFNQKYIEIKDSQPKIIICK